MKVIRKNILVNLLTFNSGGTKVFKENYLDSINQCDSGAPQNTFFILTDEARRSNNPNVIFLKLPKILENVFILPLTYFLILPLLIRIKRVETVLNFCDIPIFTRINQIFYFDWPYAVYPESRVWKDMNLGDKIYRLTKLMFFKASLHKCDLIIAQSHVISGRLKRIYKFKNIEVIKMGFENKSKLESIDIRKLKQKEKILLYPTKYYPHKNVEILVDVARKIRDRDLPYKIYCTVDKSHHRNVATIINQIEKDELGEILIITGELNRSDFKNLFEHSIAILMPTLLETYGLPYIEAIAANKLIFTSDLDFARITCEESAFYFDPCNASSIVAVIESAFNDPASMIDKLNIGLKLLDEQSSWRDIMRKINALTIGKLTNGKDKY